MLRGISAPLARLVPMEVTIQVGLHFISKGSNFPKVTRLQNTASAQERSITRGATNSEGDLNACGCQQTPRYSKYSAECEFSDGTHADTATSAKTNCTISAIAPPMNDKTYKNGTSHGLRCEHDAVYITKKLQLKH